MCIRDRSKAKTIYTKEQKIVQVSAVLLFDGDIAPDSPTLSEGFVVLDGVKRNIVQEMCIRDSLNFCAFDNKFWLFVKIKLVCNIKDF